MPLSTPSTPGETPLVVSVERQKKRGSVFPPRPSRLLVAGPCLALAVLIVLTAGLLIGRRYDQAILEGQRELSNLSAVLADQADRALQSIELLQQGILDDLWAAEVVDEEKYAARMSTRAMHDTLRERIAALPQVNAIAIIDRRGKLLNFSRYWPIPEGDISDRDYFRELASDPTLSRVVTRPFENRGDGRWTLYLARKVLSPDNRFMGLVLGAVELSYFDALYARILPAADYVLSWFRVDGTLLIRHPPRPQSIGAVFIGDRRLSNRSGTSRGVVRTISPVDGMDRLISSVLLQHFPIRMSVSRTVEASLAAWHRETAVLAGFVLLLCAGLGVIAWLGLRQTWNQARLVVAETARAAAEERAWGELRLRREYARFGTAMDNMTQGLCLFDAAGRLSVVNDRMNAILGLDHALEAGMRASEAVRRLRALRMRIPAEANRVLGGLRGLVTSGAPAPIAWILADGRTLSVQGKMTEDGGWLLTCEDVTARRDAEARIAFLAHHDVLTGLPNRALFNDRLERALRRARYGETCAILCLDLDRFKDVNDTLGHAAGDALLRQAAQRLLSQIRETDTVARLGGDEFAIILTPVRDSAGVARVAGVIAEAVGEPYRLGDREVVVRASIGIAMAPEDGREADELLRHADIALYSAKAATRGGVCFFEEGMNQALQERRQLEAELRAGLQRGELEMYYQPLIRAASRRLVGFEALLRWNRPGHGVTAPGTFIGLAEETGLILPIGEWVLGATCAEAAHWPGGLTLAVNLSPVQVRHQGLIRTVSGALERAGLPPTRLMLEITESVLLQDTEEVLATVRALRALGVSVALDDFGTGYSSLSYLRRFPFDKMKIDQSFVRDLSGNRTDRAIVRSLLALCSELGIATLAEGVEREEQLAILIAENCLDVQGYLFSPPVPASGIPALLRRFAVLEHEGHQD